MFDLFYKKNDNSDLFKYLEKNGFVKLQSYNPLYSTFFSYTENNYNTFNLNHRYAITNIKNRESNNFFNILCEDTNKNRKAAASFFKFSPLLDPIKYMVGKYKCLSENQYSSLPQLKNNICHKKILDSNNTAYVDSFFSYLTSKILNIQNNNFIHGIDFYGSFLAIQDNFELNISDDIEYLYDSNFFHKNKNILFNVDDIDEDKLLDSDTRNYRKKIVLLEDNDSANLDIDCDVINSNMFEDMFILSESNLKIHDNNNLQEEYSSQEKKLSLKSNKLTNSSCSSRSSNTDNDEDDEDDEEDNDEEDNDDYDEMSEDLTNSQKSEYSSMDSEEYVKGVIQNFPVHIICLEKLDNTLDALLDDEKHPLSNRQWSSCLFQIIMSLITYQKIFNFTHNDLHTNNIMYIKTDRKFINYKYNNTYYRVPTFGKLFKIIDFGRSIYTFKGKIICSDSYHPNGDAATQYNFGPYFNDKKPRLEPNKSFDLCRLACSLYDYFVEDLDEKDKIKNPIAKLVIEWTTDDKGRNILYKNNGEERYPDFKLYKMIVRTVHNHLPETQLEKQIFKQFISSKKKIKKGKIINIDNYIDMTK
jgi:hypothetical protein